MKRKAVKIPDDFFDLVSRDSKLFDISKSEIVEYYYRLGRLADQYEDLPISFIKSLTISTKEKPLYPFVKRTEN